MTPTLKPSITRLLFFQVDFDGGEFGVLGKQPYLAAFTLEALDGHFVADARHHDLAVAGFAAGVYRQQVAVEDADVFHAHAVYAQQIVGLGVEEGGADVAGLLDVLFGKDRRAGSNPADDRQAAFFGFGFQAGNADAA